MAGDSKNSRSQSRLEKAAREDEKVRVHYEVEAKSVAEKTARLRALRLAKEAADRTAAASMPAPPRGPKRSRSARHRASPCRSGWRIRTRWAAAAEPAVASGLGRRRGRRSAALRRVAALAFELGRRLAGLHHHRDELAAAAALPHQLGRQLHDRAWLPTPGPGRLGPAAPPWSARGRVSASAWARERAAEPCLLRLALVRLLFALLCHSLASSMYLGWRSLPRGWYQRQCRAAVRGIAARDRTARITLP